MRLLITAADDGSSKQNIYYVSVYFLHLLVSSLCGCISSTIIRTAVFVNVLIRKKLYYVLNLGFFHACIGCVVTVKVWDGLWRLCSTFVGHRGAVTCLAPYTHLPCIISGALDGSIRVWNLETLDQVEKYIVI